MNEEGRQMLYRIEMRCAAEWGLALWRCRFDDDVSEKPFEMNAWYKALFIVSAIRRGQAHRVEFYDVKRTN